MQGKDKLLYLIKHYKCGDYSTNDFCDLYTNTFNLEIENEDLSDEEWEHFEQLMRVTSRFSPYEADFINYPKAYTNTNAVDDALAKLCENLQLVIL